MEYSCAMVPRVCSMERSAGEGKLYALSPSWEVTVYFNSRLRPAVKTLINF
jgi:hypothetical protein